MTVANDMAAIFGSGLRTALVGPLPGPARGRRSGKRRALLVATLIGVLGATGVGVLAGRSVFGVPPTTPVATLARHAPRVAPSLVHVAAPEVATAAPSRQSPPAQAEPAPGQSRAPAPVAAASPPTPVVTAASRQPILRHAPSASAPAPVAEATAADAPATSTHAACDEEIDSCLDPRLEAADRRVAEAYQDAAAAGVQAKLLRGYRSEWRRARDEAVDRPGQALRLYGMIASDLYNLADDAEARVGPAWQ